jgi:hypothetical protein
MRICLKGWVCTPTPKFPKRARPRSTCSTGSFELGSLSPPSRMAASGFRFFARGVVMARLYAAGRVQNDEHRLDQPGLAPRRVLCVVGLGFVLHEPQVTVVRGLPVSICLFLQLMWRPLVALDGGAPLRHGAAHPERADARISPTPRTASRQRLTRLSAGAVPPPAARPSPCGRKNSIQGRRTPHSSLTPITAAPVPHRLLLKLGRHCPSRQRSAISRNRWAMRRSSCANARWRAACSRYSAPRSLNSASFS